MSSLLGVIIGIGGGNVGERILERASGCVGKGWNEGVDGIKGSRKEECDIDEKEYSSANTEDKNSESRDATVDGIICQVKHDEKTRKEYAEYEERVEWSDKKFHKCIISRSEDEALNS